MHACQVAAIDKIYAGMNGMFERDTKRKYFGGKKRINTNPNRDETIRNRPNYRVLNDQIDSNREKPAKF